MSRAFQRLRQFGNLRTGGAFVEAEAAAIDEQAAGLGGHGGDGDDQLAPIEQLQSAQHRQHIADQQGEGEGVDPLRLGCQLLDALL
ncbi:hypothetical protein D3C75_688460 [compost metagenome]